MDEDVIRRYEEAVSREMKRLYGITWNDAGGEDELLVREMRDGTTPDEFALWWGEKYDLRRVDWDW